MKNQWLFLHIILICLVSITSVFAQGDGATYEDMVRVAERMFCPICENEPLDECRNQTCIEWKEEILRRLDEGQSDDEIITYFVERYGQHVVGMPQDTGLRFLAFIIPILGALIALGVGFFTFRRWQSYEPIKQKIESSETSATTDDDYRERLERDLY